mgnify:CR=1 FL=1
MRRLTGILQAQRVALAGVGASDPADVIRAELERVAATKVKSPAAADRVGAYLKKSLVSLNPGMTEVIDRLMTAAYPAVAGIFDTEMAPVIDRALQHWPVRSGYSRARVVAGLSMTGNNRKITLTFRSLAAYTLYMRWARESPVPADVATSSSVWVSLGRQPWATATARARLRLQAALEAEVSRV